ncbi:PREDICTED: uncharacterized protein LOC109207293 [Nicotiana attenuata]|uniref:uncharacterized protein LOC109207293 n=1 Tax=Nicotiana attenuata TaxID=49451 RepID=UPI000904DBC1|nr:PREDICTED: uncharacterized protein LOC109207293 [Nicotiana attenuata]
MSMQNAAFNINNKIWIFWDQDYSGTVIDHHEQQISIELKHIEAAEPFILTIIYAKCKPVLRRPLWDCLRTKVASSNTSWCVIGDFNVISSIEEKIGGIPYQINKSLDFLSMIDDCGLTDLGYYGPRYTWSNGRGPCSIVWKRLDRGMVNDNWLASYLATTISHLASTGSDHSPLLMEMYVRPENTIRYFKFLNCWTVEDSFLPLVQTVWNKQVFGNPMQVYGDIFQRTKEFEEKVRKAEETWAHTNKESDRAMAHELTAQYVKYLKVEESVLKQKTQLQWFKDGDANSKYFHSLIRGRRRKLYIHKIKNEDGDWIYGDEAIGEAACDYFQNLFFGPGGTIREYLLSCIPSMITEEDNDNLNKDPTMEELRPLFSP